MFGNKIEILEKIAKFFPYIFIALGFVVALSGQFFTARLENRIKVLKEQVEQSRRRTPPKLDAQLAVSDKNNLFIVINCQNQIPVKAHWILTTEKDIAVSGLMLGDIELYPTPERSEWQYKQDIQTEGVKNNYVELRFDYESSYAAEYVHLDELRGSIIHKYRLINGEPYPID